MVVLERQAVEAADADGHPWGSVVKLALPRHAITDIAVLSECHHLERLDLAHNSVTSVQVQSPPFECNAALLGQSATSFRKPHNGKCCIELSPPAGRQIGTAAD